MMSIRMSLNSVSLIATCALLLMVQIRGQQPTVAEQYLFASINGERAAAGLPPLAWNGVLTTAAHQHALRMGASGMLAHQLSGESDLMQRASATGAFFPLVTENIGEGPSSIDMHHDLMQSRHHRENILDPEVNVIGIAAVPYRGELWVVEDFGREIVLVAYAEQERQVGGLLQNLGLRNVQSTARARTICQMQTGFTGPRPAFVMRYIASGLTRLPAEVNSRIMQGGVSQAEVGACAPDHTTDFSIYNIAIVLYR